MHVSSKEKLIEEIIEENADMVYRLALSRTRKKENAEDVFQDVFLKLSQKDLNFESEEHLRAWLVRVTINCSKNILASVWNNRIQPLQDDITFETKERNEVYYEVLKLPIKERTIIYLFYYEKFKLAEIAKMMGISEKNAKTRLFRARQSLKQRLIGGFENE